MDADASHSTAEELARLVGCVSPEILQNITNTIRTFGTSSPQFAEIVKTLTDSFDIPIPQSRHDQDRAMKTPVATLRTLEELVGHLEAFQARAGELGLDGVALRLERAGEDGLGLEDITATLRGLMLVARREIEMVEGRSV